MISRLNMVILMQADLEAAVAYYQQLGMGTLVFHVPEKWAEFDLAGVKVGLCPTSQPAQEVRTGLVFEVPDLLALCQERGQLIGCIGMPVTKVHGIMVSAKDPGGNIIDLYQPTPDKLKSLVEQTKQRGCCSADQACACRRACVRMPKA